MLSRFAPVALSPRRQRAWLLGLLAFFGLCYALLAVVNHYTFRTFAYDLGIFNQAIWDYAHLSWNVNSVMQYNNLLGDHFMLLQPVWSPLYWLLGSYTLVVVQIVAVLIGGYGTYRLHLFRTRGRQQTAALALLAQFFSIWGIYSALAFDYHDNVVAAMLLPWLFLFFEQDRRPAAVGIALLMLISKENMALWLVFVGLGLAWLHWQHRGRVLLALGMAAVAAAYFLLVVKVAIPALGEGRAFYHQQNYAALGSTPGALLQTIFTRPGYVLGLLFQNQLGDPAGDWIKTELHIMVLISGGYALLRRPAYLLMLAPIYAQKLLSSQLVHWGLNYQYSIEFVPVLSVALGHALMGTTPQRAVRLAVVAAVVTLAATIVSLEVRVSKWHDKSATQFYLPRHYRRGFDVAEVHRALQLIPTDAAVSALSPLTPHLAARAYIYPFPFVANANYLAVLRHDNPYPLSEAELEAQLSAYQQSGDWETLYDREPLVILRRRKPIPAPARRYFARRATDPAPR
ncbi:DUF2079 domain-containing protein [Hymenobacter sp. BT175]|uniref:DUF2079 domain-containing protein n=1 Tax=Hymenobacter translucens TaxID=2886507 RepID=UPI001D0E2F8E|nr:DUF2079 domain-containing protein [Hymenobacter translucens]MCC2545877.1 DUF2079 domain-containing protein [Hymenobacter translucens]